ncbi:MAG: hypothetical protein HKN58_06875 [Xanthomonadales bacterium]|nr:hypothetical protein [Xanthomonadales bacterium]
MNLRVRQFAQAVMLAGFSALAFADQPRDATQLLERMAAAMSQMSYQGTFVYMRGDSVETMRITHVVDENGVRERLYSIDGPRREIIRDKNGIRCVMADGQAVMEDPLVGGSIYPEIPYPVTSSGNRLYRFTTGGKGRLAGHEARRVNISPADQYRYGYELWLEESSGLLLKWVLYDNRRKALAKLMFTELRLGADVEEGELEPTSPPESFQVVETRMPSRAAVRTTPRWQPEQLPPGFKLTQHNRVGGDGDSVYEHQVYSDGLASVSVYIEDPTDEKTATHGLQRVGTANAYSRHVGSKHVTVIGEVPTITVKAIGEAIRLPQAGD